MGISESNSELFKISCYDTDQYWQKLKMMSGFFYLLIVFQSEVLLDVSKCHFVVEQKWVKSVIRFGCSLNTNKKGKTETQRSIHKKKLNV